MLRLSGIMLRLSGIVFRFCCPDGELCSIKISHIFELLKVSFSEDEFSRDMLTSSLSSSASFGLNLSNETSGGNQALRFASLRIVFGEPAGVCVKGDWFLLE